MSSYTFCWNVWSLFYKWPNDRNSQGLLLEAPLLMLSWLCDYYQNFTDSSAVHYAFVDIKSAFDSFDRNALWKALRARGIPDILTNLIEDLHTHTGATVRIGNKFSHRFSTTTGVRQGCVLAPALFLVAIDWILGH